MKFYIRILISSILFCCLMMNVQAELSSKHSKRINRCLKKHLGSSDYSFDEIAIPTDRCNELSFDIKPSQLFNLTSVTGDKKFLFIDQAKGRHELFTFIVLLNTTLEIEYISVIEYNEIHGYEIASKKWLAKFRGLNPFSKTKVNEVDAISGATLSSISIKEGIGKVLQKMNELNKKGCLN